MDKSPLINTKTFKIGFYKGQSRVCEEITLVLECGGNFSNPGLLLGLNNNSFQHFKDSIILNFYVLPNPTWCSIEIFFELCSSKQVSLEIINSLGQQVEKLCDYFADTKPQKIKLNLDGISSGVYWVKINVGLSVRYLPFILVK